MKINVNNKIISSVDFTEFETAWEIGDSFSVLEYFKSQNIVILGGDILTHDMKYTYDSWHYNVNGRQDWNSDVECSNRVAFDYLSRYINKNGNKFCVVFVETNDARRYGCTR